jgi:hypothetical protein
MVFQGKVIILNELLTQDEPVVDVKMKQSAAGAIKTQVVFDAGIVAPSRRKNGFHLVFVDNLPEKGAVFAVNQEVKIGLTLKRLQEP